MIGFHGMYLPGIAYSQQGSFLVIHLFERIMILSLCTLWEFASASSKNMLFGSVYPWSVKGQATEY